VRGARSDAAAGRVFTIPTGVAFADALVEGLLKEAGGDTLALSRMTILLPTRRAGRAVRDAFLRRAGAQPVLLPRLRPLGDVDDDELAFAEADGVGAELKPAIPDLRRRMMLARAILKLGESGEAQSPEQAVELAGELARLLDQMQTERLSFDKLATLVPDAYAQHWQRTLHFLSLLTRSWPAILDAEGMIDPAERRNLAIAEMARQWCAAPPSDPVYAAGSTGSIPATAELLGVVARLPKGAVILPGLDVALDEASWAAVDETHPQFGLKRLLDRLGVERRDVPAWHDAAPDQTRAARAALLSVALRPAATTPDWLNHKAIDLRALNDFARLDCPHPQAEAATIALLMREILENPELGRTAALITPDRDLARRVAAELKRFGVSVDDSSGQPLSETPPGVFLRLVAEMIANDAAPAELLACLKHPLAAGGMEPAAFRARVRQLERIVLRGPRPGAGLDGVLAALRQRVSAENETLASWFADLTAKAAAFTAAMRQATAPGDLLRLHVDFAEALAASETLPGADRLWAQDSGEAAANFVQEFAEALAGMRTIQGGEYPGLVIAAMGGRMVRPPFGGHPRLSILGLLEARLVQADLVILGGLNEGTWPPQPQADPWMSRSMRATLGLPSPERRIGLSAHDFVQACGAPRVVLTRATRVEGTPTVPSRWLLRLDTLLAATGHPDGLIPGNREPLLWARMLDEAGPPLPVTPPAPCPPVAARPRELSVTDIETWRRDPYALYARRILKLKALEPLDADAGAAERGLIIHAILADFVRQYPDGLPDDALAKLIAIGRRHFGPTLANPGVWAFWWPRFRAVASWIVEQERARRPFAAPPLTEASGALALEAERFLLKARADRIDSLGGGLAIIDYKTGAPPSAKEVALGFAPQLPLEAAIAAGGGFKGTASGTVAELLYWRLSGGEPPGEETRLDGAEYNNRKQRLPDAAGLGDAALAGLRALIAKFDDPETPYHARPRPRYARPNDYDHLARVGEWSSIEGGE
jgi:ATP-dependent helicase/nuclease subunit B